jgi:hypothetical protein
MIIGVNGKIGSGKDTVGKIIQYLTLRHKQLPNGYDPERDLVSFNDFDINTEYSLSDFEIKKFAGKLKLIGSILSGIVADQFEDQEFKKLYMGVDWDMTYREFLQKLGTEAMRDGLHVNVWVNALFADYKYEIHRSEVPTRAAGYIDQHVYPNWVITDMRFPNEMDAVKERKGITIRVVRYKVGDKVYWTDPEGVSSGVYEISEVYEGFCSIYNVHSEAEVFYHEIKHHSEDLHASETGLDDAEFDYEIINSGTIEDLVEKVREILIKENII